MAGDDDITAVGQAGDAGSKDPAEGSVAAGEEADPTDDGQSSGSAGGGGDASAAASQDPAEGQV